MCWTKSSTGSSGSPTVVVLNPAIIRGASNFDSNSLRTGPARSSYAVAFFRGGRSAFGIGPNSFTTRASASSGSNPPTITSEALFGWYHLS